MVHQRNKSSKQGEDPPSAVNPKDSSIPNQMGKIKDDRTPAKDKSPDDLEIFD